MLNVAQADEIVASAVAWRGLSRRAAAALRCAAAACAGVIRRDVRARAAAGSSSASRLRRQSAAERKRERFFAVLPIRRARIRDVLVSREVLNAAAILVLDARDGSGAWW